MKLRSQSGSRLVSRRSILAALLAVGGLAAAPVPGYAAPARRAVLALVGAPYMVHSVVRYRGWFGMCCTVRNAQTGATRDIGFRDNVLNREALRAFLGNAVGFVTRVYDQTGNGRHLVQATTGNQPSISADHAFNGVVPISIDGCSDNVTVQKNLAVAGISLSGQSLTVLQWMAQNNSFNQSVLWEMLTAGGVSSLGLYTKGSTVSPSARGLHSWDNVNVRQSTALAPKIEGCMLGLTSSGSALLHYVDAASASYGAGGATTLTTMNIGKDSEATWYDLGNLFCNVVYSSALSAGDVAIARAQMAAAFSRGAPTSQLIIDGTSAYTGYGSTGGDTLVWYLQQGLRRPLAILNMSIYGQTVGNCETNFATNIAPFIDATKAKRIYFNACGTNDVIGGGVAGATVYGNLIDCCNLAVAAGATETWLETVNYTGANGTIIARVNALNSALRAGVGVDFTRLVDFIANDTRLNDTDPLLSDGTHYTSLAQKYVAQNMSGMVGEAAA